MPYRDPKKRKANALARKQRAKDRDPEGFKKNQAAASRRYRESHASHVRAYRKKNSVKRAAECLARKRKRQDNKPKVEWWYSTVGQAKERAKARSLPFALDRHEPCCVLPDRCPVLGITLIYGRKSKSGPTPSSPSIDRIRPALGYVAGNVRVISHRANQIKSNATADELWFVYLDAIEQELLSPTTPATLQE